jgi:3-phosphoshikimate 1-carboxyvinyltransferase
MKRIDEINKPLRGELSVPGDKSIAHRAVIFAAIANGKSRIFNLSSGDDNSRTIRALRQMGVDIFRQENALCVEGRGWDGLSAPKETIDCGNSGTTMRLLCGVLAGRPFATKLDGDSSLRQRPMQRLIEPLTRMGARINSQNGTGLAPLEIHGANLHGIHYEIPVASAQVKSAILLAGLQAQGLTSVVEPLKSRDHTELMVRGFGGDISIDHRSVTMKSGQALSARDVRIPGDISSAAFFMVAAAIIPGSDLTIRGVGCNPTRDGVIEVLRRMGSSIELMNARLETGEPVADVRILGRPLKGVDVGPELVARTIDEYPILAVAAALAEGTTTFSDVKELRYKESDRIAAMTQGLRRLGVEIEDREDGMTIRGRKRLQGGVVRSFGDHRVAMSMAVAGLASDGGVEIENPGCVDISFPGFFEVLEGVRST